MQEEIIEVLRNENKPLSGQEIAKKLGETKIKISMRIKQLIKFEEIRCIEIPRDLALKIYHCKRRMRLYYVI